MPQIEIDDISFRYDRVPVLSSLSYTINQGDFLGITGPNGGGKTSLLSIILGLLSPTHGKINFYNRGKKISRLRFGYLPQKNMIDYQFPISVYEVIASGILNQKKYWRNFTSIQKQKINDTIEKVGLSEVTDRPIGNLSGGQQQRVLFGRALVSDPDVLILDEPTSYIDKTFEDQMKQILIEANRTMTVLFVSHDTESVSQLATHIIRVNETLEVLK